tara:strand:+ start:52 stop:243 length:192 start_codon:yes stop_codon:yes gene_type:complete
MYELASLSKETSSGKNQNRTNKNRDIKSVKLAQIKYERRFSVAIYNPGIAMILAIKRISGTNK